MTSATVEPRRLIVATIRSTWPNDFGLFSTLVEVRQRTPHWPIFVAVELHPRRPASGRDATRGLDVVQPAAQLPVNGEAVPQF